MRAVCNAHPTAMRHRLRWRSITDDVSCAAVDRAARAWKSEDVVLAAEDFTH